MKYFLLVLLSLFTASIARAESQEFILRWAADADSGAPYAFYPANEPDQLIGFEVEVIQALCAELGCKPVFVQNAWDGLVPGLARNEYDIAINGIEITNERKKVVDFSDPYFLTFNQITVLNQNNSIKNFSDLNGKKVGTISGSVADQILRSNKNIKTLGYESEYNAHQDLLLGRSDALLFDEPIARYYSGTDNRFKILDEQIGRMSYGIAISKTKPQLLKTINSALAKMKTNGTLRRILERWALWNPAMAAALGETVKPKAEPIEYIKYISSLNKNRSWAERWILYRQVTPVLLKASITTMQISIVAMVLAVSLGFLLALGQLLGPWPIVWLTRIYIEIIRGTPLLLQLFILFYSLPTLGIKLSPLWAAIIGLGGNYAACEAENYRAGILSINKEQANAALALGMSRWTSFRYVIFPQAWKTILPPMTNDFIALLKDSSIVSVITMVELTKTYSQLASTYYDHAGIGLLTAGIYLILGLPFVFLARSLEKKLREQN